MMTKIGAILYHPMSRKANDNKGWSHPTPPSILEKKNITNIKANQAFAWTFASNAIMLRNSHLIKQDPTTSRTSRSFDKHLATPYRRQSKAKLPFSSSYNFFFRNKHRHYQISFKFNIYHHNFFLIDKISWNSNHDHLTIYMAYILHKFGFISYCIY